MGEFVELDEVLKYEQPTNYIVDSDLYDDSFETPVLTAGKSFVLGYTNEKNNIYNVYPVIIFDDFTTANKYVDFPFKVKSSAMKILKNVEERSDLKYLFYLMQTIKINSEQHQRYWISKYSKIKIPLPPLSQQKAIAEKLDKADALRKKDQELLAKYDELAQSIFIDMFGDPVKNEKGWEKKEIISNATCIVPGRDKPKSFTGEIPWVTTEDINHLGLTSCSKKGIALKMEEIINVRAKIIPKESIIMTCVGDLGIISIANKPMVINQQLHSFQLNENLNNYYTMFDLSYRKSYMLKMASATTVPYMNKSICNSIPINLPPISLQNQFAEKIKNIEAQKAWVKKQSEQSENLFQALLQESFRF